jgi:hypothetical protein
VLSGASLIVGFEFQLMKDPAEQLGKISKEFQDKVDFCISANIPVPPFDITFFRVHQLFMIGPVGFSIGTCIFITTVF